MVIFYIFSSIGGILDSMSFYRINVPKIIHETIDGEVVLINLDSGSYYSLDNVGTEIWALLEKSLSVGEIVCQLSTRYEGSGEEIEHAVQRLAHDLEREGLILEDRPGEAVNRPVQNIESLTEVREGVRKFDPPVLHKYTDMQDLLLLDPIHDVDEAGWPHKNTEKT